MGTTDFIPVFKAEEAERTARVPDYPEEEYDIEDEPPKKRTKPSAPEFPDSEKYSEEKGKD